MGRKKGAKNKPKVADADKSILDDAVKIPYERTTSDDPVKQSMIDLIETGRCINEITADGIRRLDPLDPETVAALLESSLNQLTGITEIGIMASDGTVSTSSNSENVNSYKKAAIDGAYRVMKELKEDLESVAMTTLPIPEVLKPLAKEVGLPENWDKLSKTEKLKWHTENRK